MSHLLFEVNLHLVLSTDPEYEVNCSVNRVNDKLKNLSEKSAPHNIQTQTKI